MKGRDAELAFRKWLEAHGWVVHLAAPTGRHQIPGRGWVVQSHDLFGALDLLAFRENNTWGVQITTTGKASARRQKVERIAWPPSWHVSLAVMADEKSGATGRTRKVWRIQDLRHGTWGEAIAVDPKTQEPRWALRKET